MAYEYGSIDLGIRNPFRIEGIIRATRGLIVTFLGLYCLLQVKGLVESAGQAEGWLTLAIGVVLLVSGLAALGKGLFQVMRFFVGRGVPTSLAKNLAKSETLTRELGIAYNAQQLEQMIQGRKNLTFIEPQGWFARLIHSLLPKLLFLPYMYRNMMQRCALGIAQTLFAFACYGLAWFSGITGLTTINDTPVLSWLAVVLTVYLLVVWAGKRNPLSRHLQIQAEIRSRTLAIWLALSIILPFALTYLHHNVMALPSLSFASGYYVFLLTFFGLLASSVAAYLVYLRIKSVKPVAEVSEMRSNWQESIHPQEIFINFENIVMANRRYKEVPNRVYREFDASLIEEGSNNKGQFRGEMIQETQPVFRAISADKSFTITRIAATALGHMLLLLSAFWLYSGIDNAIALAQSVTNSQPDLSIIGVLLITLMLWIFGSMLANFSHAFWAEMQFESLMVYFQCQGTYTESKLSTGTSIFDSTRSENVVVRSSLTPWVMACRVVSSSFTESGSRNLEFPRHILEIHRADTELQTIVDELRTFMKQRETIASLQNEKDLAATANIYNVNQQTRAAMGQDNAAMKQIPINSSPADMQPDLQEPST